MNAGFGRAEDYPGVFVSIEGGEGGGKSTQAALLCEALRARGKTVLSTREPGGSAGAEAIRALLVQGEPGRWDAMSEVLLLLAARRDHLRRTILPALAEGTWVICDRFGDSTMAYQGYAGGLGREAVETLAQAAIDGFSPALTFILDLPVEAGLARAGGRVPSGEDRFERMGVDFHRRLREAFLDIAHREPERCRVVDATQPVAAVQAEIFRHLLRRRPDLARAVPR